MSGVEREAIKALSMPVNVTREYWRLVDGEPGTPRMKSSDVLTQARGDMNGEAEMLQAMEHLADQIDRLARVRAVIKAKNGRRRNANLRGDGG